MPHLVSQTALNELVPFSFTMDEKGQLRWVGRSLQKIMDHLGVPATREGLWTQFFELERPAVMSTLAPEQMVQELIGQLVVMKVRVPAGRLEIRLRGQLVRLQSEDGSWIFALTPALMDAVQVSQMGLSYMDFPPGDPVFDFLLLLQSERRARAKSEKAREKLTWDNRVAGVLHDLALLSSTASGVGGSWELAVEQVMVRVCRELDWDFAHLWLVEHTDREQIRIVSSQKLFCREPEGFSSFIKASLEGVFKLGEALPGKVIETAATVFSEDFTKEKWNASIFSF